MVRRRDARFDDSAKYINQVNQHTMQSDELRFLAVNASLGPIAELLDGVLLAIHVIDPDGALAFSFQMAALETPVPFDDAASALLKGMEQAADNLYASLFEEAAETTLASARLFGSLCFAPGTRVLMADGTSRGIEDLHAGELVLADDPDDNAPPGPAEIVQVHKNATYRLVRVTVGGEGRGDLLATGSHPFWTQRGWVAAEDLKTSDSLLDATGRSVPIRALDEVSRDSPRYNLSVAGKHTFFVLAGKTSVLVHNVDPWDIWFTQNNFGPVFTDGPWKGRSLAEAVEVARGLGRLPDGLEIKAVRLGDGTWATLNNRTLAVAREANLVNVNPIDAGASGENKMRALLRESDLAAPIENAVMRCK